MFKKTGTWIDPQGATHTEAVFKIAQASLRANKQSNLDASGGYADALSVDSETISLDYQALYWTNQAALDAGLPPYPLLNTAKLNNDVMMGQEEKVWFRIPNLTGTYSGLTAENAAEKHCKEVTLV